MRRALSDRRLRLGRIQVYIEPRDAWVGVYLAPTALYVCALPFVVLRWQRDPPSSERGAEQVRTFTCRRPAGPAPFTAARDVAALILHDARCSGGDDCEGPVIEDYQAKRRVARRAGQPRARRKPVTWVLAGMRCPKRPFCTGCQGCFTITAPNRATAGQIGA